MKSIWCFAFILSSGTHDRRTGGFLELRFGVSGTKLSFTKKNLLSYESTST